MKPDATAAIPRRLAIVIPLVLFCTLLYTFLHEGGHALFGMLFGGKLTEFNINFIDFSAHVSMDSDFSPLQQAVVSAAGISLPILVWAVSMILLPVKSNPIVQWFKILFSLGTVNTLLAWMIIPFLYLSGNAPGDDSTTFLTITGLPPLLVSCVALLVYLGGWLLFFWRTGGWGGIREIVQDQSGADLNALPQRNTAAVLAGIAALILVVSFGLNALAPDGREIPGGFTLMSATSLSERSYADEPVAVFDLAARAEVRLFFVIDQVNQGPLKLELRGPDGYGNTYFEMMGSDQIGHATIQPEAAQLEPGRYEVLLTAPLNKAGLISVYASGLP